MCVESGRTAIVHGGFKNNYAFDAPGMLGRERGDVRLRQRDGARTRELVLDLLRGRWGTREELGAARKSRRRRA